MEKGSLKPFFTIHDIIVPKVKVAKRNKTNIFITTQKDEAKLKCLVEDVSGYSFNVMELGVRIEEQ